MSQDKKLKKYKCLKCGTITEHPGMQIKTEDGQKTIRVCMCMLRKMFAEYDCMVEFKIEAADEE